MWNIFEKNNYKEFTIKVLIFFWIIWILFFLFQVRDIILIFIFAIFLNILFSPFLDKLNKKKIPDWLWIIIIYLLLLFVIFILFAAIIPIFAEQIGKLSNSWFDYFNALQENYKKDWIYWLWLPSFVINNFWWFLSEFDFLNVLDYLKNNFLSIWNFFTKNFSNFIVNWLGIVSSITWIVFKFVLTFIFAFFIVLERKDVKSFFYRILPENLSKYLKKEENKITDVLNLWLRWQILLSVAIFLLTFTWLNVIRLFWVHINLWETFSLWLIAGLMEFIPYVWPFLALLPALAIAWSLWLKALIIVFVLYIVIQQTENNFLVPYIMSKAVKLSPFAVLFWMAIWASLFGILWILVAVPVISIIQIFLNDYFKSGKK
ncbi:MAG: protein of unknown function UPF0118 [uncultured bacterium (gcode 4)]|uniref:Permease n=1 Tax=uncultured bacterium (gcode 4) TaxID=1234023 RepID=K2G899_9BACT|nr:MAG: protein of unknown function UPF0118 [uncultured bacterium (gcode 4)]